MNELARELGIASHFIYRWCKKFEKYDQGSLPGYGIIKMIPKDKELADLKEKMRKLELENGIFKSSADLFKRQSINSVKFQFQFIKENKPYYPVFSRSNYCNNAVPKSFF